MYLGNYKEDDIIYFLWGTNEANGASITRTVNGEVRVYKDNNIAQSTAGITDTEDFDGLTGVHACTIDLSADAFYAVGADYSVVLQGATIDGKTVNSPLAHFSIENRFQEVDVVKLGGVIQSLTDLKDFADAGYDPSTNKIEGCKVNDDMRGTDSAALATTCTAIKAKTDNLPSAHLG